MIRRHSLAIITNDDNIKISCLCLNAQASRVILFTKFHAKCYKSLYERSTYLCYGLWKVNFEKICLRVASDIFARVPPLRLSRTGKCF